MLDTINVTYESTSNAFIAERWLNSLPDIFAADFEVAIKYSPEQLAQWATQLADPTTPKRTCIDLRAKLTATALDHPSHNTLTHFSAAASEDHGFVLILDNPAITNVVLRFLTSTTKTQIWHNASYDFRQIYYRTRMFPINYEDTQILAKTLLNHTNNMKSLTGLKRLAGHRYGNWGISEDNFDLAHMYDPHVLHYATIDACATYWLWNHLQQFIATTRTSDA